MNNEKLALITPSPQLKYCKFQEMFDANLLPGWPLFKSKEKVVCLATQRRHLYYYCLKTNETLIGNMNFAERI